MNSRTCKYMLVLWLGLVLAFTFSITNKVAAEEEPQFNILLQREARIKPGKNMEAMQFAKEVIAYGNKKFPESKARAYFEIFGDVGKIHWIVPAKDLATFERQNRQLMTDPGYIAILNKAVGLFIEGSVHDTLMRMIP